MAGASLAEKKAAIEKLLDKFEWHTNRVRQISREGSELLGPFSEVAKDHGAEGISVLLGLMTRLRAIAAGAQTGKPTVQHGPVSNVV